MTGIPPSRIDAHPGAATLGAYHDGELGGDALTTLEAHLADCPRCRRELRELDRLDGALGALPEVEPSPQLYDRVLARVDAGRPPTRMVRPWNIPSRRPLWAAAAALAALTALLGGYYSVATSHLVPIAGTSPASGVPAARSLSSSPGQDYAGGNFTHRAAARPPSAPGSSIRGQGTGGAMAYGAHSSAHSTAGQAPPLSPDARLIARTGEVDLRVADVQRTYTAASGIAARAGGYVSDSNNNASGPTNGAYAATLNMRVPAARFEETMGKVAALAPRGGLLRERSGSQDITDGYHDLQARLQALQATRVQLTAIMRGARSITDAITVLDRLTDVNTSIDSVQGQITAGANSIMFSTITVNIAAQPRPRRHVVAPPPRRRPSSGGWQPGRDLANALANLGAALRAIVTVAIYAIVYLALPALVAAAALLSRRLRRRTPRIAS